MTSVALHADQVFYRVPGGTGTYVRELAWALAASDAGLELTLFHARFRTAPPADLVAPRVEIPGPIRLLYPAWNLLGRPALPERLRGADVVHAASPVAVPPVAAGQRLAVTVHDLAFRVHPRLFPRAWRALFSAGLRRAVRRADALIAVSRHTAEDLVRLAGADRRRVHVVPLAAAVPRDPADPEPRLARLGVPRPYVLFVGTLEPRKNVVRLVRAYRRAAEEGLPHALVLAGPDGWGRAAVERELRRPGPGRITRAGNVSAEDLDALYRGAAAFVYPSLYEGFGLPVLEAMARGVPTVVSAAASLPEVAGDAAMAVDPRSVEDLAAAIRRVAMDEDEARRLADAGRARAATFTWEETARRTIEVYRSIAGA